jgi:hypothetical protein
MTPVAGSIEKVMIFSGVSWATASMSMPPSVETTKATGPCAVDQHREIEFAWRCRRRPRYRGG